MESALHQFFGEHVRLGCSFRSEVGRLIKLQIVKATVISGFLEQFRMRPSFLNRAAIQHDDLVGGQNGRETMRDRDHGATNGELFERFLNLLFRFGIER